MVSTNRFALLDAYVALYYCKTLLNCKNQHIFSILPLDFVYAKHKKDILEFICTVFTTAKPP
jgi:hypothetical protein